MAAENAELERESINPSTPGSSNDDAWKKTMKRVSITSTRLEAAVMTHGRKQRNRAGGHASKGEYRSKCNHELPCSLFRHLCDT